MRNEDDRAEKQTDFEKSNILASNDVPSSLKMSKNVEEGRNNSFGRFSKSFEKVYCSKSGTKKKPFPEFSRNPEKMILQTFLPGIKTV